MRAGAHLSSNGQSSEEAAQVKVNPAALEQFDDKHVHSKQELEGSG